MMLASVLRLSGLDRRLAAFKLRLDEKASEAADHIKAVVVRMFVVAALAVAAAVFALLALIAMTVVRGWWRPDTFMLGSLNAAAVQSGQWWRAITALTLHLDIVHLLMNLGAGAAIGFLASRQIGAGHAWFAVAVPGRPSHRLVAALRQRPGVAE